MRPNSAPDQKNQVKIASMWELSLLHFSYPFSFQNNLIMYVSSNCSTRPPFKNKHRNIKCGGSPNKFCTQKNEVPMPAMEIISCTWHELNTTCWLIGLWYLWLVLQAMRLWNPLKLPRAMKPLWQFSELTFILSIPNSATKCQFPHLNIDIKYFGHQVILKITSCHLFLLFGYAQ